MRATSLIQLAFLAPLVVTLLAQPSPPSEAVQLGDPETDLDLRMPLTVVQCEPVFIYYNKPQRSLWDMWMYTPNYTRFLVMEIPIGIGYLEWICNIPAGYGFIAYVFHDRYYVVQPGSSSSCLGDITATYGHVAYATPVFQSFTGNTPDTTLPTLIHTAATYVYIRIISTVSKLNIRQDDRTISYWTLRYIHCQVRLCYLVVFLDSLILLQS